MSEVIAIAGSSALVPESKEDALGREIGVVEADALRMVIANDTDYAKAGDVVKAVKAMHKRVVEYWEPLRVSSKKTYDDVLARKKEMISPLECAEKILKGKMGDYVAEQNRKRKEREESVRKLARQEVDRKLAEAAIAESEGDALGVELAMTEAEIMDDVANSASAASATPKSKGVSTGKSWTITNIDISQVPVEIAGAVIRPVDERAVMALIKATKGSIKIPGITYEETVKISVRA